MYRDGMTLEELKAEIIRRVVEGKKLPEATNVSLAGGIIACVAGDGEIYDILEDPTNPKIVYPMGA